MSNLWSRMTIPASNGPPAPVGSLRLEAGTHATSGNEIIGSGESARRAGDRGRSTCGRVTVAVKKTGNHEGHEEHEGMRRGRFDGCRVTSRVRRIGRRTFGITGPRRLTQPLAARPDRRSRSSSGSVRTPIVEPSFQRRLALGRRLAENEVFHANVLVQLRPVNSATISDESPILPFLCCPMAKAWKPGQRNGNRATIREFSTDRVIRNDECSHADVLSVNRGRSHSRYPSIEGDVRLQFARAAAIPLPRSPRYVPGGRGQAKTSPRSRHVPHEHAAAPRRHRRRRKSGTDHSSRLWASRIVNSESRPTKTVVLPCRSVGGPPRLR